MTVEEREKLFEKANTEWRMGLTIMAHQKFMEAAEAGHAEAALTAGLFYYEGISTRADHNAALHYFCMAKELGCEAAEAMMALVLAQQKKPSVTFKEAFALMRRYADEHPEFYHMLAEIHYDGELVEQNMLHAAYYAIKGVQSGAYTAYYYLGELYFQGAYLPSNMAFAKYCFEQVIKEVDSVFDLSEYNEKEEFCQVPSRKPHFPRFDDDAPDFFDRPCPYGLYMKSLFSFYGEDGPIDPEAGKRHLEESMALGNASSYAAYATRIIGEKFDGKFRDADGYICFPPSYQRAKKLFHQGAELYDPTALYSLGVMYASGEGGFGRDYEKSKHYLDGYYFYTNSPEAKAILDDFDRFFKECDSVDYTPIESYQTGARCPICQSYWMLILNEREYEQYEIADHDGNLPDGIDGLTLFEREFFQSKMCPECQARFFTKPVPELCGRWLKVD